MNGTGIGQQQHSTPAGEEDRNRHGQQKADQEREHHDRVPDPRRHADRVAQLVGVAADPIGRLDPQPDDDQQQHSFQSGQIEARPACAERALV